MKFIKSILSEMGWGGEGDMKLHALAGIFSLIAVTPFFISHPFFAFPLSIRIFYAILCFLISLILIIRLNYWTIVIVAWLFRANLCEKDASFAFQSVTKFFFRRVRAWWEKKLVECANIVEKSRKSSRLKRSRRDLQVTFHAICVGRGSRAKLIVGPTPRRRFNSIFIVRLLYSSAFL